jgi:hypothetical protein
MCGGFLAVVITVSGPSGAVSFSTHCVRKKQQDDPKFNRMIGRLVTSIINQVARSLLLLMIYLYLSIYLSIYLYT